MNKSLLAKGLDYFLLFIGSYFLLISSREIATFALLWSQSAGIAAAILFAAAASSYLVTQSQYRLGFVIGILAVSVLAGVQLFTYALGSLWTPYLLLPILAARAPLGNWGNLAWHYSEKRLLDHIKWMSLYYKFVLFLLPFFFLGAAFDGGFKDSPRMFQPGVVAQLTLGGVAYIVCQLVVSSMVLRRFTVALHLKTALSVAACCWFVHLASLGAMGMTALCVPTIMLALRFNNLKPQPLFLPRLK